MNSLSFKKYGVSELQFKMSIAGTSEKSPLVLVRLEHDGAACCFKAHPDGDGMYTAEIKNPGCIFAEQSEVDFAIDVFFTKRYQTAVKSTAVLVDEGVEAAEPGFKAEAETDKTETASNVNIVMNESGVTPPPDLPRVLKITKSQIVFR